MQRRFGFYFKSDFLHMFFWSGFSKLARKAFFAWWVSSRAIQYSTVPHAMAQEHMMASSLHSLQGDHTRWHSCCIEAGVANQGEDLGLTGAKCACIYRIYWWFTDGPMLNTVHNAILNFKWGFDSETSLPTPGFLYFSRLSKPSGEIFYIWVDNQFRNGKVSWCNLPKIHHFNKISSWPLQKCL